MAEPNPPRYQSIISRAYTLPHTIFGSCTERFRQYCFFNPPLWQLTVFVHPFTWFPFIPHCLHTHPLTLGSLVSALLKLALWFAFATSRVASTIILGSFRHCLRRPWPSCWSIWHALLNHPGLDNFQRRRWWGLSCYFEGKLNNHVSTLHPHFFPTAAILFLLTIIEPHSSNEFLIKALASLTVWIFLAMSAKLKEKYYFKFACSNKRKIILQST